MPNPSPGPLARYQQELDKPGFSADPSQLMAVEKLQRVFDDIAQDIHAGGNDQGLLARVRTTVASLFDSNAAANPLARGLYLWGGVGRGKTWLMDLFYESLPFEMKMRAHFHRFMRQVHRDLKHLSGESDPLKLVAETLAAKTRVICFDEFFVADITDAMILGTLFQELFARDVVLVATSNIPPEQLYKDGLQRQRFLPAIDLLQQRCEVFHMDGGIDYRLRVLEQAELYHFPLDAAADAVLRLNFDNLAPEPGVANLAIEIEGRPIQCRCCADDVVWFEFDELCGGPRSQNDYIELAQEYHAVLVSNIPVLGSDDDDQARRFINLIDEFYDRNVKMVISAAVDIEALYEGTRLRFEFARTASRLREMQSHEYLARPHRP